MSIQNSWAAKNIFSIISLAVVIGGFIAGYARLEVAVSELKNNNLNREIVRQVTNEVMADKLNLLQKDISYLKERLDRQEDSIKALFRLRGNAPVVLSEPGR